MTTFTTEDLKNSYKCLECNKPALYLRHTQFAGIHPYCKEHGMEQEDYFVDDSYTYWTEITNKCPWDEWKATKDIV